MLSLKGVKKGGLTRAAFFAPNYLGRTGAFENGLPFFVGQKQGHSTTALDPEKETNTIPQIKCSKSMNACLIGWHCKPLAGSSWPARPRRQQCCQGGAPLMGQSPECVALWYVIFVPQWNSSVVNGRQWCCPGRLASHTLQARGAGQGAIEGVGAVQLPVCQQLVASK